MLRAAPASAQLVAAASRAHLGSTCTRLAHGLRRAHSAVISLPASHAAASLSIERRLVLRHSARTGCVPSATALALLTCRRDSHERCRACARSNALPARQKRAHDAAADLAASLPSTAAQHLHGITHTAICARNSACYVVRASSDSACAGVFVCASARVCTRACLPVCMRACVCLWARACGRMRAWDRERAVA